MEVLDGDDVRLSSRGKHAERDIVQVLTRFFNILSLYININEIRQLRLHLAIFMFTDCNSHFMFKVHVQFLEWLPVLAKSFGVYLASSVK